jgi:hypothetical protein
VSTTYGRRDPAPQARYACRAAADTASAVSAPGVSAFVLRPLRNPGAAPAATIACENGPAFRVTLSDATDYLILPPLDGAAACEAWGMRFAGGLMWLRTVGGKPAALRCLDLTSLSAPAFGLNVVTSEPVAALAVSFTAGGPVIDYGTADTVEITSAPVTGGP